MAERVRRITLRSLLEANGFVYQNFTESERECISRVTSKEINAGKEQDQAVAIAISECAPEKAQSNKQAVDADELTLKPKPDIPGGKFQATENQDGTWNVSSVPIFAEHSVAIVGKGSNEPQEIRVSRNWMFTSMKKAVHRFMEDDYLPPLHIHHHIFGKETQPAGFFKLKRLDKKTYEGRELWTLFADLISVPREVYALIRQGKLPYRSVEIHDLDKPEIDSLALLDDEVPFFRFNLLTIGDEQAFSEASVGPIERSALKGEPMCMYQSIGSGMRVLQYMGTFKEDTMPKDKIKVVLQDEPMEEEEKKKTDSDGEKMDDGGDMKEAIMSRLQGIADSVTQLMQVMGGGAMAPGEEEEKKEAPAPVEMSDKAASKAVQSEKGGSATAEYSDARVSVPAKSSASETKLQARVDAMEFERDLERKVMSATRDLVTYGLDESSTTKKLMEIGKKKGLDAIDVYTDAVKENLDKDPGTSWTDDVAPEAGAEKDLVKYAAEGQKVYEGAVKYSREYDELVSRGMRFSYDKEQFIDDQLQSEGFKVPAKKQEG